VYICFAIDPYIYKENKIKQILSDANLNYEVVVKQKMLGRAQNRGKHVQRNPKTVASAAENTTVEMLA